MIRSKTDAIGIFAIYDSNDFPIFIGTKKECAAYIKYPLKRIYKALSNNGYINANYSIYYIFEENITEKKCRKCGLVKPLKSFPNRKNNLGYIVTKNICKNCSNIRRK